MKLFYSITLAILLGLGIFGLDKALDFGDGNASSLEQRVGSTAEKTDEAIVVTEPRDSMSVQREAPRQLTCDDFDPVGRPEDVPNIIMFASGQTGVPAGILYGTWMKESGEVYGDRGSAGGCDVMSRYRIRRAHGKRGRAQFRAIRRMEKQYPWRAASLRGSCGTSTMSLNTGNFGGCIGPLQITPSEWVKEDNWQSYDPLKLCDAMILSGRRLKRHHDRHVRNLQDAKWRRKNPRMARQDPWQNAIRRYIGGAWKPGSYGYYSRVVNGTKSWKFRSGWKYWDAMLTEKGFSFVIEHASKRAKKWR